MTKTLLELACRMAELDYDGVNFYSLRRAEKDLIAAYPQILELCEAAEGVLSDIEEYERINNLSPSPEKETCWQSVARLRRALKGE